MQKAQETPNPASTFACTYTSRCNLSALNSTTMYNVKTDQSIYEQESPGPNYLCHQIHNGFQSPYFFHCFLQSITQLGGHFSMGDHVAWNWLLTQQQRLGVGNSQVTCHQGGDFRPQGRLVQHHLSRSFSTVVKNDLHL